MTFVPRDTWIGAVLLAFAVIYWREADKIRISPLDGPVGASGLPKTLAWGLGILAVILIVRSLVLAYLARKASAAPVETKADDMRVHLRAAGMLLLGVGYLLVIPYLGYLISIGLLLVGVALYFGAAINMRTALVAILGAAFFYVLFVYFLDIPLPSGMLFDMLSGAGN